MDSVVITVQFLTIAIDGAYAFLRIRNKYTVRQAERLITLLVISLAFTTYIIFIYGIRDISQWFILIMLLVDLKAAVNARNHAAKQKP